MSFTISYINTDDNNSSNFYEAQVTSFIISPSMTNIPDIKKLIRVLDIVPANEVSLTINSNNISYSENGYKFRYHVLDDGIIKLPNINVNKINNLEFDTNFTVNRKILVFYLKVVRLQLRHLNSISFNPML